MKRPLILALAFVICCAAAVTAIAISDNENFEADEPEIYVDGDRKYSITFNNGRWNAILIEDLNTQASYNIATAFALTDKPGEPTAYVIGIGDNAFKDNTTIQYLWISHTVRTIGTNAFYGCTNLSNVIFPDTASAVSQLTVIGSGAFSQCTNLTTILTNAKLDNLTTIEGGAFLGCSSLIAFPLEDCGKLTKIDSNSFDGCSSLTSMFLPKSLVEVAEYTFAGCSDLSTVTFETGIGITAISEGLFLECYSLTDIEIPASVKTIYFDAFNSCTSLSSVTFEEDSALTTILETAFSNCDLYTIDLPSGVVSIGAGAFIDSGVYIVTLPESNMNNQIAFKPARDFILVGYDIATIKSVKTETISSSGLSVSITTVLPFDVKALSVNGNETSATFAGGMWTFEVTTTGDQKKLGAIYESPELTYETVTNPVGGGSALIVTGGTNLIGDITIPRSVGHAQIPVIGVKDNAFKDETLITSVEIGMNVTSIGQYAFRGCVALTSVTFSMDKMPALTTIGSSAFENSGLTSFSVPDSVTFIDDGVFAGCEDLTTFDYGNSQVTTVGVSMFQNTAITSIAIPSTVEIIFECAFYGCEDLASVTFGSGSVLGTIYDSAFSNCGALTSISLPESLTAICGFAFNNTGLTSIHIPGSVVLDSNVFIGCADLETVVLGYGIEDIPSGTFDNCSALKSLGIPSTILTVDNNAFADCNALKVIALPVGTTITDDGVFSIDVLVIWFSAPAVGMMTGLSETGNIVVHIQMPSGKVAEVVTAGYTDGATDITVTGTGNTRTLDITAIPVEAFIYITEAVEDDDNGGDDGTGGGDDGSGGDDGGSTPGGDGTGGDDSDNGGGDNTMLFIGIGAAVAIVALAGVYFLFIRKP